MSDITLTVQEEAPLRLKYVEAKIKPEQTKDVVPTYEPQTVLPDAGMTLGQVNVAAIPDPTDTLEITENGKHHVERVGVVDVNVPQGVFPTGTKQITSNGLYDVSTYESANVDVNTNPEKGFVLSEYDSDGYPTKGEFVGEWTIIPSDFCHQATVFSRMKTLIIPEGVTTLGGYAFCRTGVETVLLPSTLTRHAFSGGREFQYTNIETIVIPAGVYFISNQTFANCSKLKTVTCLGNIGYLGTQCFYKCDAIERYDFSHNTEIPSLDAAYHTMTFPTGCVICIPAALSDTTLGVGNGWESSGDWANLTDVVWEVV